MTDMVTRVARALWNAAKVGEFDAQPESTKSLYLHGARSAIEAMREPNDEMLDKMNDVWVDAGEVSINVCFADLKELFAVGIDAALKENEEKA
jgi:hypothetical protein